MTIRDVLKENKRLKAVRRRKEYVRMHNFRVKTIKGRLARIIAKGY